VLELQLAEPLAEAKVLRSVRLLVVAEPRFIPTAFASAEGVHATDVVTP